MRPHLGGTLAPRPGRAIPGGAGCGFAGGVHVVGAGARRGRGGAHRCARGRPPGGPLRAGHTGHRGKGRAAFDGGARPRRPPARRASRGGAARPLERATGTLAGPERGEGPRLRLAGRCGRRGAWGATAPGPSRPRRGAVPAPGRARRRRAERRRPAPGVARALPLRVARRPPAGSATRAARRPPRHGSWGER